MRDEWPVVIHHPDAVVGPLFWQIIERIAALPDWRTLSPGILECRLVETLIRVLLSPIRGKPSIERSGPEPVNLALQFMRRTLDEHPHRAVSLRDLARQAGVTEKHLCRRFQQSIGHAPMKTFMLLKLQLALALLARSNFSIKEIADRCGFANPLYFTRCFTKAYGTSPSLTRDQLMNQNLPAPRNLLPPDIAARVYW
jgi:AraC-like DNA-binding protein